MLPLVSPLPSESREGDFLYVDCSDGFYDLNNDRSGLISPLESSPGVRRERFDFSALDDYNDFTDESSFHRSQRRRNVSSVSTFKQLVEILHDKIQLLTDQTSYLKKEIGEKSETIDKLIVLIDKFVHPKVDDDDDVYNRSVETYNIEVAEYNLEKQKKNITTRRRKTTDKETMSTSETERPTSHQVDSSKDEILFLKEEIANKNRIIDFLVHQKTVDPMHRLILEDADEDDDDDEQERPRDDEFPQHDHDDTLEVMERLFINDGTVDLTADDLSHVSIASSSTEKNPFDMTDGDDDLQAAALDVHAETLANLDETKTNGDDDPLVASLNSHDETMEPEEEPSNDHFNTRLDKIEQMILNINTNNATNATTMIPTTTEINNDDEMLNVAPWDKHSNGFATNYMIKNGHQAGKGLGKTGTGITEPISSEKKTLGARANNSVTWPKGTVLIAGASMIAGLDEKKMSGSGKVKVRSHGGATIIDMRDHLNAILRKRPDHLILHVHSNDASDKEVSSDDMFDQLMDLKDFAMEKVDNIKVTFSLPIIRTDNAIANVKQMRLKNRLKRAGLSVIANDDIDENDLGRKGLHLKASGTRKLARNIIEYLKSL